MTKPLLRVAGFMSGAGSNLRRLLEYPDPAFEVIFLFSDNAAGQAQELALDYNLPCFVHDVRTFYKKLNRPRILRTPEDWKIRAEFDRTARALVEAFRIDLVALGGYMSLLTPLGVGAVNVHPGDLTVKNAQGERLLRGDRAVEEAIVCGHEQVRASTLWVNEGVDSGPLLLLSDPLPLDLPCPLERLKARPEELRRLAAQRQDELKAKGDWRIFPLTVQLMAQGRLTVKDGIASLDGRAIPDGITLEEI
ncbi:MAG: formyl transferase [Desulfarculales bacterium]|jgi:folate-dependent phosphoribosylglycinamide formyltransferase PurN|nr:formyl transferase [Desulfarculales bacterium]